MATNLEPFHRVDETGPLIPLPVFVANLFVCSVAGGLPYGRGYSRLWPGGKASWHEDCTQ